MERYCVRWNHRRSEWEVIHGDDLGYREITLALGPKMKNYTPWRGVAEMLADRENRLDRRTWNRSAKKWEEGS
jgi:hypothetical protein